MTQELLRQEVDDFLLLQRVAQRVNATLELEPLLEQTVHDVAETFGYCRSAVLLRDEVTNDLVISHGWTGDRIRIGDRFEPGGSGIAGHVGATRTTHYAPDVTIDRYYEIGHPSTRSEVDIPLMVRGNFIGIFNVQHTEHDAFSPSRVRLLEALADHLAIAIDNARMFQRLRVEKNRMFRELTEAQRVQSGLLPGRAPKLPGFTLSGVCVPCRTVGGDWYDYVPLPDGRTAIVLGDVAGKGSAAALLMSSTRSLLRLIARDGGQPADVLHRLNQILLEDFPAGRFVTMVYAVLDAARRRIVFANAGHPPPLLVNGTGASFQDTSSGLPLGTRESDFAERELDLPAGSRLVLYSDGINEASSASGEEYGRAHLRRHFSRPGTSVHSLLDDIREFQGDRPLADDATIVMVTANA
jgi:sigma-B regulation protein RsbU (phosphoserine phosphatase)